MNIQEDYVSFETAKLLKEKGFEGHSILTIYDENAASAYIKELQEKHLPYSSDDPKFKEFYYTKPTHQMAMKWLREVHNLFIDTYYDCDFGEGYKFSVHKLPKGTTLETHNENYSTYEQTCEAAIKYCLENLI